MNPSAQMVQSALGQTAFDPKQTVQVAVDPRRRDFEWRHGSRHEFGSVGAIEALAKAQAKRDAKKTKRRQTITKNAQRYAGRAGNYTGDGGLNPITFVCPPPKPSNAGSDIVYRMAAYHAHRDAEFRRRTDMDWAFHENTKARWAREEAFRKAIEAGHDPFGEDDEHEHVHGPGCGHDHETAQPWFAATGLHDTETDHAVHTHGPDCGCDHEAAKPLLATGKASAVSPPISVTEVDNSNDGFYAAGSDSSGNRLGAPVLVTSKDYVPPQFKVVMPAADAAPVPGHELVVLDGKAPAPEPISDGKVLANKAWLVTWMLANGRATELKASEALKQMKSDTHSVRRGMGVKKDAIPSAEVLAIMQELGIAMPTRAGA